MTSKRAILGLSLLAGAALAIAAGVRSEAGAQSVRTALPPAIQKIFDSKPCLTCHQVGNVGQGKLGPNLRGVGSRRDKAWLRAWLKNPPKVWGQNPPDYRKVTSMPPALLSDAEIETMVDFLSKQKLSVNGAKIIADAKSKAAAGKKLFEAYDCGTCHKIGGKGGNQANTGPDLAGVSKRRDAAYLTRWLKNPQKVKKNTFMPNYGLSSGEVDALVAYLKTL